MTDTKKVIITVALILVIFLPIFFSRFSFESFRYKNCLYYTPSQMEGQVVFCWAVEYPINHPWSAHEPIISSPEKSL